MHTTILENIFVLLFATRKHRWKKNTYLHSLARHVIQNLKFHLNDELGRDFKSHLVQLSIHARILDRYSFLAWILTGERADGSFVN